MSLRAVIELPLPILMLAVVLTVASELAEPTDTSPPPLLADSEDALPIEVAPSTTSLADNEAPAPTLVLTVGVEDALVFALLTCTRPPLDPLAAEVTTPSPDGAPASARAPPTPSSNCVPVPADVMSIANCCAPVPSESSNPDR